MHEELLPKIKNSSQGRSETAVKNILEAADSVLIENSQEKLTARNLASKSGYSIGALYHYFNKAEDVFILNLLRRREKRFLELINLINEFPEDKPLRILLDAITDIGITELNRMNKKSFILVARMIFRFSKTPWAVDNIFSTIAEPLIAAERRNTTGTFRRIQLEELKMLLKIYPTILRRPFLEYSPIAGTQKHKDFIIDTMERLLGKSASDGQ